MQKKEIDDYFVKQIPMLYHIINGLKVKHNKKYIDGDICINESYIHLWKNIDKIETELQLQKLIVNYITKTFIWTNSAINIRENIKDKIDPSFIVITNEKDNEDLETKIEIDNWYFEKMEILKKYKEKLDNENK